MLPPTAKMPGVSLTHNAPQTQPELLTGVPLFLGLASALEPERKVQKLTLKTHFDRYFTADTESAAGGYLRDAVWGFFENGGRLCYAIAKQENTVEALQQGLIESETIEEIDLICAPDIMRESDESLQREMQLALLAHCQQMGDRFAILDAVLVTESEDLPRLNQQRQALASDRGALYAPWLELENRAEPIPPCGQIAGIYASADRRVGVHAPPGNFALEGVLDLSFALTPSQQQQLNPLAEPGVNCIRSFRGRGIRIWGVRTLSPVEEWQYINIRRLFLTFGRWVNRNLADMVFEPHDFALWLRLARELSIYCESLWQEGALQGAIAQEAFYVKCDGETNPPASRSAGKLIAEIGLAPTVPGEFIQLLLVQSDRGFVLT